MKIHVERNEGERLIECQQTEEIAALKSKVEKLDKTMFFGNGEPSIKVQLATQRQNIDALTRISWIVVTAVIGQLCYMVFQALSRAGG